MLKPRERSGDRPEFKTPREGHPTPAWRYVKPEGKRSCMVRISCNVPGGKVYGSGCLVKYRGKILVLTARHVIDGAKKVVVILTTGKKLAASVVKADAEWDCAVLEMEGQPEGCAIAELQFGKEAMQTEGARLDSVGFGPEGKLAANSGLFIGYRRNNTTDRDGPDDWFAISGHARQGDSGGPVFNESGKVVGVLWGTDGEQVICVQAGRLHLLLNGSVTAQRFYRVSEDEAGRAYTRLQYAVRKPTPPAENDGSIAGVIPGPIAIEAAGVDVSIERHLLPFRNDVAKEQANTRKQLDDLHKAISGLADAINKQQQPGAVAPIQVVPPPPAPEQPKDGGPKTIIGKIADKEAQWLADHGGPISSRIAKNAEENLDSDSAAVRFKGFTQAKVAVLVFCVGILLVLGLGVMAIHKINNKVLPSLQAFAAKTPNTIDDKIVGLISKVHDKVDAVEERIKGKFAGAATVAAAPAIVAAAPILAPVAAAAAGAQNLV
jgi:hypothetical protein